ncbi:cytochrome c family protein [Roseomonas sp. KE2513]|uniref:c-type cytochrome n=1 Tax=Roseomonas sp. KE2513 TaxID=2479202 RepID=UPI0018DF6CAA|nr:c-type cytochrome [Roseomonas sp. KE2513]MBI0538615.1 cytochrome c family protein [Roseomonas sp. KE2513]
MRAFSILLAVAALAAPAAAADAEKGKTLFQRQCATCHQLAQTRNGAGPHLQGVMGRAAASVQGYNYSPALRGSGIVWTPDQLDAYLANPVGKVPGTRMAVRVGNDSDRADIVAFLQGATAP